MNGEPFVDEQLAKRSLSPGVPIGVVPVRQLNEMTHLTLAGWRGIPDAVRKLMRQPEGKKFGVESQTLCIRIGHRSEVLEASESDSATIYHELTGIRSADPHHEQEVDVNILLQELRALLLSSAGEGDNVGALEHLAQLRAIGQCSASHDVGEMRSFRVYDVVLPIRLENTAMGLGGYLASLQTASFSVPKRSE